jgi:hypothetical protein
VTPSLTQAEVDAVVASCAEGYPFPTNLDRDPPLGGLAPESQQDLFSRALHEAWTVDRFRTAIRAQVARRQA